MVNIYSGIVLCLLLLSGVANTFPTHSDNWLVAASTGDKLRIHSDAIFNFTILTLGGSCKAAGHTGCCQGGINRCIVRTPGQKSCYCDERCHRANQCCFDILDIGCLGKQSNESINL